MLDCCDLRDGVVTIQYAKTTDQVLVAIALMSRWVNRTLRTDISVSSSGFAILLGRVTMLPGFQIAFEGDPTLIVLVMELYERGGIITLRMRHDTLMLILDGESSVKLLRILAQSLDMHEKTLRYHEEGPKFLSVACSHQPGKPNWPLFMPFLLTLREMDSEPTPGSANSTPAMIVTHKSIYEGIRTVSITP